jgi:hypothetical protein
VYSCLPVTQGLTGAAVAARKAVVGNDLPAGPRYLTALAGTLSEAIVPVLEPGAGAVVGTLDGEGGERDAFTDADGRVLGGLPRPQGPCSPRPPFPPEASTRLGWGQGFHLLSLRPTPSRQHLAISRYQAEDALDDLGQPGRGLGELVDVDPLGEGAAVGVA